MKTVAEAYEDLRREIAGRLGLSAERVRQIEQRVLGKLRAAVDPER
jgi:DNA-directed RNA polymerase sigma subunit (sigma70/sigma32)